VDLVGSSYSLHAASGSLAVADSTTFAVTPGTAASLAVTTQPPASSQSGATFGLTARRCLSFRDRHEIRVTSHLTSLMS